MIKSKKELSSAIVSVLNEFVNTPVAIDIYFKGERFNYDSIIDEIYSTETIVRVLQSLVVRGKLNPSDIRIVETYVDEEHGTPFLEHEIAILQNGMLSEAFESYLYSLNGQLHLDVARYNCQLDQQEV